MPKSDYNRNTGRIEERESSKREKGEKYDDPNVMTEDEVEAAGGLGAIARRNRMKKNSAGAQGDALKATPTPTPRATPTPRPRSSY